METVPRDGGELLDADRQRSKGEEYEKLAFTFCKIATVVLLTGRWALPIASGVAAIFYVLAETHGKKDTRCVLRKPLLIAAWWGVVCAASLFVLLRPHGGR